MNRARGSRSVFVWSAMLALNVGSVFAQTPGQIPVFDPLGTAGACNSAVSLECVDSVITQDANANIGIGTPTPAGKLHVANSNWSSSPVVISGLSGAVVGATVDLDSTAGTNGRKYSIISTASGAAAPAGSFGIWDNTANAYRLVINNNGNVGPAQGGSKHLPMQLWYRR